MHENRNYLFQEFVKAIENADLDPIYFCEARRERETGQGCVCVSCGGVFSGPNFCRLTFTHHRCCAAAAAWLDCGALQLTHSCEAGSDSASAKPVSVAAIPQVP